MKDKDLQKDIVYEITEPEPMMVKEALPEEKYSVDRIYTYEDYLNWPEDERVELIDGKIYHMPTPNLKHQELLGRLAVRFANYLYAKDGEVYFAPFDVRVDLDFGGDSVVQPDLIVICDESKLDDRGLNGAPDLVVEVLLLPNVAHDKIRKFNKYLEVGVREYWIVDPMREEVMVNILTGIKYESTIYFKGDRIKVDVLDDLVIDVTDLFEGYKGKEIVEIEMARREEKIEMVKNLLSLGVEFETIVKASGLAVEVVESLLLVGGRSDLNEG